MSWHTKEQIHEGRKSQEPHPDYSHNFEFLKQTLRIHLIQEMIFFPQDVETEPFTMEKYALVKQIYATKIRCKWHGIDKNRHGDFRVLTHFEMSWRTKRGIVDSYTFNLHQPSKEFEEEVKCFFEPIISHAKPKR